MPDPKGGLTKFSTVLEARTNLAAAGAPQLAAGAFNLELIQAETPEIARSYSAMATSIAAGGTIADDDAKAFSDLAGSTSISTVEELAALAIVDRQHKSDLVSRTGVPVSKVHALLADLRRQKAGKAEVRDWSRYSRFRYETGCEIDAAAPLGPELGSRGGAALEPAIMDFGAAPGTPPGFGGTSLINVHMSAIRDQGNRGTCTAFAGIACLEYHHRSTGAHRSDLSEQFAYWDMVTRSGQHALVPMFQLLRDVGVCTERTWPYYPNEIGGTDGQGPPPPRATVEAPTYRARTVLQLVARSVPAIKAALAADHVVAIGIPVYDSWFQSPVVRKYGNITVPLPREVPHRVGHAVALVGYEDTTEYAGGGYFIVRNSWDSNWGTESVFGAGYGTIPYRYIADLNMDAWYVGA